MREILRKLNSLFDRRTKLKLFFATGASVGIALLDTVAIALILPLVNLATGQGVEEGPLLTVANLLGEPSDRDLTLVLTVVVVALFILKDVGAITFGWWLSTFKIFNRVRLSSRILSRYLVTPYTEMANRSPSELVRTMNDAVTQVFGSVVYALMNLVASIISILAITSALLYSAPYPTIALTLYLGLAAFMYMRFVRPRALQAGVDSADASREAWKAAFAALGGIKETQLRGSQQFFVDNYERASMRGGYAARTVEVIGMLPRYLLEILFILAVGVILGVGIVTNPEGGAAQSLGILALFVAAGFRVLPSITGLIGHVSSLRFGARYLDVVHDELIRPLADTTPRDNEEREQLTSHLGIEKVSFRYPGAAEYALKDVSLVVPKGHIVALVGGSGAGKTTLVDLILGLHTPDEGCIRVDGHDVSDNLPAWRSTIGYVPQDVYLFEATLAENIAFDKTPDQIDGERLRRSLEAAQLWDYVARLPDGVQTEVGERGTRLSGGQRQRVGIARALYRDPSVLVLDEATSALDNETEHRFSKAVFGLRGQMTVIIVAHRLSTVQHADEIVYLENGSVAGRGSFSELSNSSPGFAKLVSLGTLRMDQTSER